MDTIIMSDRHSNCWSLFTVLTLIAVEGAASTIPKQADYSSTLQRFLYKTLEHHWLIFQVKTGN